ncbi:hypothetical protein FACS189449_10210 [Alphaproteobacteria bacterium]|nr:hypothetical protein FACS189449_10210 [Alphaproteobacteria bacterium]
MKRILISVCFVALFLLIWFGVEAATSSRKVVSISSNAHLAPYNKRTENRKTYTLYEYQKLVGEFYIQNDMPRMENEVWRKGIVPANALDYIREKLGSKEYPIAGGKGIPTIDLSWPNIKRVFLKKFEEENVPERAKRLKDIIKKVEDITYKNFLQQQQMIESQTGEILSMCFNGDDSLFNLTELENVNNYHEDFVECIRGMLGNYTGFQRIMSLLAVSILNSSTKEGDAFVLGFSRIGVKKQDDGLLTSVYNPNARRLEITEAALPPQQFVETLKLSSF